MAFSRCTLEQRAAVFASCILFGASFAFAGQQTRPAATMARNSQGAGVFYNAEQMGEPIGEPMKRPAPKRNATRMSQPSPKRSHLSKSLSKSLSKRSQETIGPFGSSPATVQAVRDGYFTLLPPSRDDLQFYAHGMVPQAQSTSTAMAPSTRDYWSPSDRVFFSHGIFPQAQPTSTTINGKEMPEVLKDPRPSS